MYQVQDSSALVAGHRALLRERPTERRVPRTVVLLGLTSLLTDISSEMVAAVLPLYLVYAAGFTPLQLGIVDGLYRGAAALVALASGFAADRRRRHKEVASLGYGLSAACKLGARGGRRSGRGDRRDRHARPRRQGHPHRASRRADLAVRLAASRSARRSACTGRWTRRARCSGRCSPSACSRSPRSRSTPSSSSRSASPSLGLGVIVLLVPGRPARAAREARAVVARRAPTCCVAPRFRGARRGRVAARHGHDQRRVPLPRAPAPS